MAVAIRVIAFAMDGRCQSFVVVVVSLPLLLMFLFLFLCGLWCRNRGGCGCKCGRGCGRWEFCSMTFADFCFLFAPLPCFVLFVSFCFVFFLCVYLSYSDVIIGGGESAAGGKVVP